MKTIFYVIAILTSGTYILDSMDYVNVELIVDKSSDIGKKMIDRGGKIVKKYVKKKQE